jgi:hypothetical protein
MKPVGEPDAGNPHVRFDERGGETERLPYGSKPPRLSSTLLHGPWLWVPGVGGLRPPFLELKNADAKRRLPLRGAPERRPS